MKFVDLFCGIGGFHQALTKLGHQCVFACDINKSCRETYEKNYGITPEGDIKKIKAKNIPPFDILCAGFPCQPFSKAGFQKGFEDERGNLFYYICKIVKHHRPKYLLMENVRNLATHDKGNTWAVIKTLIEYLGYKTYEKPVILNVLHFDVPQFRERVVIMCQRNDLGDLPVLPRIPKRSEIFLTKSVKDLVIEGESMPLNEKMETTAAVWDEFIQLLKPNNVPKFPIWTDWWDSDPPEAFYTKYKNWIDKNRAFYNENRELLEGWLKRSRDKPKWKGAVRKFEWQAGELRPDDTMNTVIWTARGSGIRVKRPDYIPALVAMSMIPVYEGRKLTPKELLGFQSFRPDFQYDDKKIYTQLGNAVNVEMIYKCAEFLMHGGQLLESI